jgi:uncharacterized protein with HEPN domain
LSSPAKAIRLKAKVLDRANGNKALEFAHERERRDIYHNDLLAFAIVRAVEIIGEAATHVSIETREALPQIPWKMIIGMRNRVIHDYIHVNRDIIWDVIVSDLPPLKTQLEAILSPLEPDAE